MSELHMYIPSLGAAFVAVCILVCCYLILFSEKLNRAVTAMMGACLMVMLGILSQEQAFHGVDFNTIALLTGMMIIVGIAEKSGIFQYVAIWSAKKVKANPRAMLIVLAITTAVFSALLDNVTTVLLIVPVTIQITRKLDILPYPFIILEIFASNIGGTATLIGDPPNILIGSALELSFMDFVKELTPLVAITMTVVLLIFDLCFGRFMQASEEKKQSVMAMDEKSAITDKNLLIQSLIVIATTILGFIVAEHINRQNGTIALCGAILMLLLHTFGDDRRVREVKVERALSAVDWTTIFFFIGLFVIVYGLEATGILSYLGHLFVLMTEGSIQKATFLVLWFSAFISAFIDNIPFVATMIPVIKSMEESLGGREVMMPVWWSLSIGACFGGNGSLVAASANVIVVGLAQRDGHPLHFGKFLLWSFPIMTLTIIIATIYLYIYHYA